MVDERRASNAIGGKTARPCDGCLQKRARWFCPADDAFLCQSCDHAVHSANQLASRHTRVRLATSSFKVITGSNADTSSPPAWHHGFTRKARTPRNHRNHRNGCVGEEHLVKMEEVSHSFLPLVPEIGGEEEASMLADDLDDQFSCRVPDLHQFDEELDELLACQGPETETGNFEGFAIIDDYYGKENQANDTHDVPGFHLPSAADLTNFEVLLDSNVDDENGSSLQDPNSSPSNDDGVDDQFCSLVRVKDELMSDSHVHQPHWSFDIGLPETDDDVFEEKAVHLADNCSALKRKSLLLTLNYDAVMNEWASQGSPWTDGIRPQLSAGVICPTSVVTDSNPTNGSSGCRYASAADVGREARVLRYKEKRRTRLFSKKIRYEVRKLNAEKRPRLKGRFVKRTSFAAASFPYLTF